MKVRIENNSLRIRFSQTDVQRLETDKSIQMVTPFASNQLTTTISITNKAEISCDYRDNLISLMLPIDLLHTWKSDHRVGFEKMLLFENGSKLLILVEKDFKKLVNRRKEDESDLFPNPKYR